MYNKLLFKQYFLYILAAILFIMPIESQANDWLSNNQGWLKHLAGSVDQIYKLVTGAAYVIGCSLAFKALYTLKVYGELRTMMASQSSLKEPLTYLMVAAIFIFLPTGFGIMMNTTFGESNVLAYSQLSTALDLTESNGGIALLSILQLIGVIAFVRGWVLLARSQGQGAQPGTMGKAITHVFGGVMLMNIVATVNIMYNTLGIKF